MAGLRSGWVASDDAATTFWRADVLPGSDDRPNHRFRLSGPPVTSDALGNPPVLRLWEYGVGDQVRRSTFATLRRLEPEVYELDGDIDFALELKARALEASRQGAPWAPVAGERRGGWFRATLAADTPPLRIRLLR